jgi:PAS domain S-box-containing protein
LRSGERIIIENIETDARYAGLRSVARDAGYRAVQSTPLIGHDGAPLGMISTHWKSVHRPSEADLRRLDLYVRQAADFIERSKADEALRESDERLQLFVEHAPIAIAMFDRHMRYLVASRRWVTDYRLEGQDIVGRSHYEIFPDIPERWRDIYGRCLAEAIEASDEDLFDRLDGSRQWLRWEIQPWKRANGQVGGIVMFTEDITDRKRMEQEREELVEQLKNSKQDLLSKVADLEVFSEVALRRELKLMHLENEVEHLKSALQKLQQK